MLKRRPVITFWIAFGEQLDFSKKNNKICNMGSVEDQKRTYPEFSAEGFTILDQLPFLIQELFL